MRNKKHILKLKEPFDEILKTYSADYLLSDPLKFAHQYEDPYDQEAAAFIASALAYGSVPQIFQILTRVLKELGKRPARFLREYEPKKHSDLFQGFYYRFHEAIDFKLLIYFLSQIYKKHRSLGVSFRRHFRPEEETLRNALSRWIEEILEEDVSGFYPSKRLPEDAPVRFFFSSPKDGSSCKRLNLFLRWMVRGPDGLDLRLWDFIPPSKLVIPLDTHIYRIARSLKLTERKSPNWNMAEEITGHLRLLDPHDPIKYDFALTRLGILQICPPKQLGIACRRCERGLPHKL